LPNREEKAPEKDKQANVQEQKNNFTSVTGSNRDAEEKQQSKSTSILHTESVLPDKQRN